MHRGLRLVMPPFLFFKQLLTHLCNYTLKNRKFYKAGKVCPVFTAFIILAYFLITLISLREVYEGKNQKVR